MTFILNGDLLTKIESEGRVFLSEGSVPYNSIEDVLEANPDIDLFIINEDNERELLTRPEPPSDDEQRLIDIERKIAQMIEGANNTPSLPPIAQRHVANASIDVQNVNDSGIVNVTHKLGEGPWEFDDSVYTYNGDAAHIAINAHVSQAISQGDNIQRPAPQLKLERGIDGEWSEVATSSTGYIRDQVDVEESSNTIFYRDINPPRGVQYRLTTEAESSVTDAVNSEFGQFDLEAKEDLEPSETEAEEAEPEAEPEVDNPPNFGTANDGTLTFDDFADGNNNRTFRLQVRNTTRDPVNWTAVIENVPYETILDLQDGDYDHDVMDNGDDTFSHIFIGTEPLEGFANVLIEGGRPSLDGQGSAGDNPVLFYTAIG